MEIREFKINGKKIQFINASRSTRHGFAHDTEVLINGYHCRKSTCHYLNRTWECFRYQTVMLKAISEEIEARKNEIKNHYKSENGLSRLTAKHTAEVEKLYKKDEYIKLYNKIYKKLQERSF